MEEFEMFEIGEKVLYSVNGVCVITDITEKCFGKTKIKYYVLKPLYGGESTLFVPVNNESLVKKMKKLLTQSQLDEALEAAAANEVIWNNNDNTRKEEFKNVLSIGNIKDILVLLKSIWMHRKIQLTKGRKLHISDEMYLREAEKIIKEEISTVVGVDLDDVIPYIKDKILA